MKKKRVIFIGIILLALILCFSFTHNSYTGKKKTVQNVVYAMFNYPGEASQKVLDKLDSEKNVPIIGETEPGEKTDQVIDNTENDLEQILKAVYAPYFTEKGFEDFCNERHPLRILLLAEAHNCAVTVDTIKSVKEATDKDNAWQYDISLFLGEEKEKTVKQKILISYEKDRISTFQLMDNTVENELNNWEGK